tara:strand:- start:4943 stop:5578 length:636 start_codon:yes stop_codon:yes gene_type:complete
LLRDAADGPEILYLRRNPDLRFMGGFWVFPGGRIEASDAPIEPSSDEFSQAKRAAAREAQEEAGVEVVPNTLHPICEWTTPEPSPIRFATWFFAAVVSPDRVEVDGSEILDYRWERPQEALQAHRAGEVQFANPTFALSTRLLDHESAADMLTSIDGWKREHFLGRIHRTDGGKVALYAEDCAYENGRIDCDGPRHRIWMLDAGWRYERQF